jgi:hypothetical protein
VLVLPGRHLAYTIQQGHGEAFVSIYHAQVSLNIPPTCTLISEKNMFVLIGWELFLTLSLLMQLTLIFRRGE